MPIPLTGIIAVVDERGASWTGALDTHFTGRLLTGEVRREPGGVLLLIDWKGMRLPFRLARSVSGAAHIRGEEAPGRHAEAVRPKSLGKPGWSVRLCPTANGNDVDPEGRSHPAGPMPERCKIAGLL